MGVTTHIQQHKHTHTHTVTTSYLDAVSEPLLHGLLELRCEVIVYGCVGRIRAGGWRRHHLDG